MIDYSSIISILNSDGFVDNTDCFEFFLLRRYLSLENCRDTGSSLTMKTLACFLDQSIDTKDVFLKLKIGKSDIFSSEINSYRIVWLDFSDFNADSYDEAIDYIRHKMSDIYKPKFPFLTINMVKIP